MFVKAGDEIKETDEKLLTLKNETIKSDSKTKGWKVKSVVGTGDVKKDDVLITLE